MQVSATVQIIPDGPLHRVYVTIVNHGPNGLSETAYELGYDSGVRPPETHAAMIGWLDVMMRQLSARVAAERAALARDKPSTGDASLSARWMGREPE